MAKSNPTTINNTIIISNQVALYTKALAVCVPKSFSMNVAYPIATKNNSIKNAINRIDKSPESNLSNIRFYLGSTKLLNFVLFESKKSIFRHD